MRFRTILRSLSNGSGSSALSAAAAAPGPAATAGLQAERGKTLLKKLFGKYLLLTNTVSAGLLMVAGDLAAQEIEFRSGRKEAGKDGRHHFDWTRVGQMFLVGALSGPPHHVFYKYLDRLIPKATTSAVFKKIAADQLFFSPVCIFVFFYGAGMVEGHRMRDVNQELKQKFWTVYKTDWSVWPAAQFINFYFLPPHYRVLYVNVVTTLYNVFLSHIKHKDMSGGEEAPKTK